MEAREAEGEQADRTLRDPEEHYRPFFENNPLPMWVYDRGTLAFLAVNGAAIRHYGYSREEFLGMTIRDIHPPEHVPALLEAVTTVPGQLRQLGVWRQRRKDGTVIDLEIITHDLIYGGREARLVLANDVTERKRAEERLRESEERFRRLAENAQDMIYRYRLNPSRGFEYVSPAATAMTGYTPAEHYADPGLGLRLVHPEDRDLLQQLALGGESLTHPVVLRWVRKDGTILWTEQRNVPVHDAQGNLVAIEGIARDITKHKQAEEALAARTQQLEAVRAVTTEIARELNVSALLSLIIRRAVDLVSAAFGVVVLWDEDAQVLVPQAWHGLGEWMKDVRIPLGEWLLGIVAQRGRGMIVNDYRTSPYRSPLMVERTGMTAGLAEPLLYRDRLVGVIEIGREGPDQAFTEQDQEILAHFATQAAIAIENARLFAVSGRAAREARSLYEVAHSLATSLDPTEVLHLISAKTTELLGTPHAQVVLWDADTRTLRLGAAFGTEAEKVKEQDFLVGTGVIGIVAETRTPLIVNDYQAFPSRLKEFPEIVADIGVPLLYRGHFLGVLNSHATCPGTRFTQGQLALLTSFADHAAVAIQNARLFEQVRLGRKRLQTLSRRLVEVQEAERRDIARELHDEIGQLLTGLKLLLEMGSRGKADAVEAHMMEAQGLVNDLMERVRDLSLNLRPAMLDDLGLVSTLLWHLERYSTQTQVQVEFRHAGVDRRFSPEIETAVYRIIQEALTNVARHAGAPDATVHLWADQDSLGVQVQDRGVGFHPDVVLAAGFSSGLLGMRERTLLLGGCLTIESTPRGGTRLTAEFPLSGRVEKRKTPR